MFLSLLIFEALAIIALIYLYLKNRKRYKALKNSHEFINMAFDNFPEYIFVKDKDFKILQCNRNFLELYPEDKRDTVIGYTTVEEFDPDEAKEFLKQDQKAFDDGFSHVYETIHFADGKVRTLSTKKIRFTGEDNKEYILGIASDVTDMRDLQDQTEESQAMYRMIMDFLPGYVFLKNRNSEIIFANEKFINMYPAKDQDKIIGHTTFDLYAKNIRDGLRQHDEEAFNKGDVTQRKKLTFPNGAIINAIIRKKIIHYKGEDLLLCLIAEEPK